MMKTDWPAMFEKVRLVLLRRGRSAQDADDLVQEAWVRLACYERECMPVRNPAQFLLRTAVNLSIDLQRVQANHGEEVQVGAVVLIDTAPGPEAVVLGREQLDRVSRCLGGMTERTRDIFLANRVEGLTYDAIAAQHGLSVSTVEKHMAKATMRLMQGMKHW